MFQARKCKTKNKFQTVRGMLDSGSKLSLFCFFFFLCWKVSLSWPTHTFLNTRITTVLQDSKACRAALGEWKCSVCGIQLPNPCFPHLDSSYLSLEGLSRRCVRRRSWRRFNPPGPHVRQELVRDLSQHVFGEPGHAQDVISGPVNIVSEWDKLRKKIELI